MENKKQTKDLENENFVISQDQDIKLALKEIEKKYGKEAIMLLGEVPSIEIDTFHSGSYSLDKALGINGLPKGRIIEIYGPESGGKTTLSLHAIASIQANGGIAAFIDAEHSIDPNYAAAIGVDINNLILSQPDSGEKALEIVDILAKTGKVDLIVVDSVAALVPEAELQGEMIDQQIGLQARLMSKALRKITGNLNKNKTTIIFINQIREKVGTIFGNPETTPGGRALKFYSSIRIEVRKGNALTELKDIIGNEIKFKVVKNKLAAPYKTAISEIYFAKGIDKLGELVDLAVDQNLISKKGAWYFYQDKSIAQGKKAMRDFLEENPDFKKMLVNQILIKKTHVGEVGSTTLIPANLEEKK